VSSSPYAPDKALAHLDRLYDLKRGKKPPPVQVHLVISDLCNQHCSFCSYRTPGYTELFAEVNGQGRVRWNPNRMIETTKAKSILKELSTAGVKAIQFTGGGEPTVHPDCNTLMHHAKVLGMDIALVTNGTRVDKALLAEILECTWVRISIDHAHRDGYAAMRSVKPDMFDVVIENVRRVVEARKGIAPTVGIGFVVNKDNYAVIEEAVQLYKELGVDNVRLSAVFQPDDDAYFKSFHREASAACQRAVEFSDANFTVINNYGARVEDLAQHNPDYRTCHYQYMTTYVGADLNVYRCCVTSYTNYGKLGSLAEKSFEEIWWKDHGDDLSCFDARCCPRCQFNDKNRAMQKMLNPEVEHENFV
jgi:MoaA/NifB/PqqE/SkfB family radical SAM enzyme